MTRSLSLAAVLAAGLAFPALAEPAPQVAAFEAAKAKSTADSKRVVMVRTLGAPQKSCSPFQRQRQIVWRPLPQTKTQ